MCLQSKQTVLDQICWFFKKIWFVYFSNVKLEQSRFISIPRWSLQTPGEENDPENISANVQLQSKKWMKWLNCNFHFSMQSN